MGTVIYSVSPLQAMLGSLGTIAFLLGLGIVGIGVAIFRPNQRKLARISTGVAGLVLVIAGLAMGLVTLISATNGSQTVNARLNQKNVSEQTCGQDSESTCTRYILETEAGSVFYDFIVTPNVYDQAEVNTCYQFTYYRGWSPFNVAAENGSYHQIDTITRIAVANPSACP